MLPGRCERPAGTIDVSLVAWRLLPLDWVIPRTDSVPAEWPELGDGQMSGNLLEVPNRTCRGAVPGGDIGNRREGVEMREGAQPFYRTPRLQAYGQSPLETARQGDR